MKAISEMSKWVTNTNCTCILLSGHQNSCWFCYKWISTSKCSMRQSIEASVKQLIYETVAGYNVKWSRVLKSIGAFIQMKWTKNWFLYTQFGFFLCFVSYFQNDHWIAHTNTRRMHTDRAWDSKTKTKVNTNNHNYVIELYAWSLLALFDLINKPELRIHFGFRHHFR